MMTLEETKKFRYWFKYTHTDNKIVEGRKNIKIWFKEAKVTDLDTTSVTW